MIDESLEEYSNLVKNIIEPEYNSNHIIKVYPIEQTNHSDSITYSFAVMNMLGDYGSSKIYEDKEKCVEDWKKLEEIR